VGNPNPWVNDSSGFLTSTITVSNNELVSIVVRGDTSLQVKKNNLPFEELAPTRLGSADFAMDRMGAYVNSQHFDGFFCEVICFSRVLTDNEVDTVQNYLLSKWGIS
jgi:hypothetical protein